MSKKQKRNTIDGGTNTKKRRCDPVPSDVKDTVAPAAVAPVALTATEEFQRQLRVSQNSTRFQSYLFRGEFKKALAVAKECKNELDNASVHVNGHSHSNPIRIFEDVEADEPSEAMWNEVCEIFMKTGARYWLATRQDGDGCGVLAAIRAKRDPFRAILTYVITCAEWMLPALLKPADRSSLLHDVVSLTNPAEFIAQLLPHVLLDELDWVHPVHKTTALQHMCWDWKFAFNDEEDFISVVGLFMERIPYVNPHRVKLDDVSGLAKDMIINGCKKYDEYFLEWRPRAIREVLSYPSETSASPVPLIPDLVDIIIGYLGNVL
jgi:hypothetical protein